MKLMLTLIFCGPMALSTLVRADDQRLDAATGGSVGTATGVVVTSNGHRYRPERGPYYASPPASRPHYQLPSHHDFCQPGQPKKGRC